MRVCREYAEVKIENANGVDCGDIYRTHSIKCRQRKEKQDHEKPENNHHICGFIFITASISAQTGGTFEITQSVIAGGGQPLAGGAFSIDGTTGQAIAGDELSNEPFVVTSGFWNYSPLPVTAANATVSGRVLTNSGEGIPQCSRHYFRTEQNDANNSHRIIRLFQI